MLDIELIAVVLFVSLHSLSHLKIPMSYQIKFKPPQILLCFSFMTKKAWLVRKSRIIIIMNISCLFLYLLMLIIVLFNLGLHSGNLLHFSSGDDANSSTQLPHLRPEDAYFKHRKLMLHGVCSKWDISISQSRYPTPGIPEFIVQIVNTCVTGCAPSNIHVRCGWFASARIVNPRTFKRLSYDDCLVNGGQPLKSSQSIRFTYANSFMYPLEFKSASFC